MSPKFTSFALSATMLASTRLAITKREVAGPQVSPDGQSASFEHLVSAVRHIPVLPPDEVMRHVSPATPATHVFGCAGVQVLAGPMQALVSTQGLFASFTVHG